jgi:hypothetical protein
MVDNNNGSPPDTSDAKDWADTFGVTHPVIADDTREQMNYVLTGYPTYVIIDREMTIQEDDLWPFSESYVVSLF